MQTRWCAASREELIAELEGQQREIERLRQESERADHAERERAALRRDLERLRRDNDRLRKELDAARRAGCRQAAPFSKNRPSPRPRRPGRKPGPAYGRPAHRSIPPHIDKTHDAPLPARVSDLCGAGGRNGRRGAISSRPATGPPDRPRVSRPRRAMSGVWTARAGPASAADPRCARRGGRPDGPARGGDGRAAVLHKQLGLPLGKVAAFYQQHFGLTVTTGGLVHALHRAARQATPTYAALVETVRRSPLVAPDETGWRVGAQLQWLWVYATPTTTVYAIQPGRGFDQAAAILGADFAGILVRDGWAPYRRFHQAAHQTRLAQYAPARSRAAD